MLVESRAGRCLTRSSKSPLLSSYFTVKGASKSCPHGIEPPAARTGQHPGCVTVQTPTFWGSLPLPGLYIQKNTTKQLRALLQKLFHYLKVRGDTTQQKVSDILIGLYKSSQLKIGKCLGLHRFINKSLITPNGIRITMATNTSRSKP